MFPGLLALLLLMLTPDAAASRATLAERLAGHGPAARARLAPHFEHAGVDYPPRELTLIGLKEEKELEVWARQAKQDAWTFIRRYPILAASGGPGPKLREGDLQVPEGVYGIELLNPNSRFHLSLRINYPNTADRARAREEKRSNLGGDIMIHGRAVSIGCLAMGDEAIEELFVLAADTGLARIQVLLCPADLRSQPGYPVPAGAPSWTAEVYATLRERLVAYPLPPGH